MTLGVDIGKIVSIPSIAWYIEGAEKKILVDTGMCDTERANKFHYPGSMQTEEQRIDNLLISKGVNPESIEVVILTHLHWDHCSNLKLFKNAQLMVQERELNFALDPLPPYYKSYESQILGLSPPFSDTEFTLLDGDTTICPGVDVIVTAGHSPGHQSVIVRMQSGATVIAGDAVMVWENLKGDPKTKQPLILPGRYMDLVSTWRSMERIKEVADLILPGHESAVFNKNEYC